MCVKWFHMRWVCMQLLTFSSLHALSLVLSLSLSILSPSFPYFIKIKHFVCVQRKQKVLRNSQWQSTYDSHTLTSLSSIPSQPISFPFGFLTHFSFDSRCVWKSSCKLQIIHCFNGNSFTKDMPIPHTLNYVTAGKAIPKRYVCVCVLSDFIHEFE